MSTSTEERSAPPLTPRPMWHVPIFLIGLGLFAGAWFNRPLFTQSPVRQVQRDLHNARAALNKPDGDSEYALKLASRAFERSSNLPEYEPEAAFLAGSASLRLAEKAAKPAEHWIKARQMLEKALELGVADGDRHTAEFRLAKAGFHTRMDRNRVTELLEAAAPNADNRAEAYALLSSVYLKATPPDLNKALEANRRLRELQEISDSELITAKLAGAEILLRLNRPGEARKSLDKVEERAPVEIAQRARLLRARTFEDEKDWREAANQYEKAFAGGRVPPDAPLARYHLGLCYRGLDQKHEAVTAWQECLRSARGPELMAAALALADLHLSDATLDPAFKAIEAAFGSVPPPGKWSNSLVAETKFDELLGKTRQAFLQAQRHDLAYALTKLEAGRLDPARATTYMAQAAAGWGRMLLAKGGPEVTRAGELLLEAGKGYETAADQPKLTPEEQVEQLYQAAKAYLDAGAKDKAATALFRLCGMTGKPERMGEACYLLAEHYAANGEHKKAAEKYLDCTKYETRYEYLARYRLAMADLQAGNLDDAQATLVYNLKMLRWDDKSDRNSDPVFAQATTDSLFALSNLLYQKRDYNRVVHYLEELLARAKDSDRSNPKLTLARFQLADAYRQIAARELMAMFVDGPISKEARDHREAQQKLYLQRAAEEFLTLNEMIDKPEFTTHLTKEQKAQVPFIGAKCLFNLGKYKEALEVYDRLALKYPNQTEALDALGGAVQCHAAMKDQDLIRQRLLQIEQIIPHVPEKVGAMWKEWVKAARAPLTPIE